MMAVINRMDMRVTALSLTLLLSASGAVVGLSGREALALADDKPQSELLKPFQGTWALVGRWYRRQVDIRRREAQGDGQRH